MGARWGEMGDEMGRGMNGRIGTNWGRTASIEAAGR